MTSSLFKAGSINRRGAFLGLSFALFVAGAAIYPLRSVIDVGSNVLMQSLPAFAHALFFTFLLSFRAQKRRDVFWAVFVVLLICSAFETLQHDTIAPLLTGSVPISVQDYATFGTFDLQDLLLGAFGCFIAGLISLNLFLNEDDIK